MQGIIIFCIVSIFSITGTLRAQVMGSSTQNTWVNGLPLKLRPSTRELTISFVDANAATHTKNQSLDENYRYSLGWGKVWRIRPSSDRHPLYSSSDGTKWTLQGYLVSKEVPLHWVPMGEDTILATGWRKPIVKGGSASVMASFRRNNEGEFVIQNLIHPLTQTLYTKIAEPREGQPENDPALFEQRSEYRQFIFHNFVMSRNPFRALPDGAAFISLWSGEVWLINTKGDIRNHFQLFNRPAEKDWSKILLFEPALLGAEPTADGTLLLASRSEKAALHAREQYPVAEEKDGRLRVIHGSASLASQNQENAAFMYPEILWWVVDPKEGGLKKLESPPHGAPSELPTDPERAHLWVQGFVFETDSNGVIRVGKE